MATNHSSKKSLSVRVKIEIISNIEKGEKQATICKRLGLPKTTVSSIWKNRESLKRSFTSSELQSDCKRFRSSQFSDIDAALLEWFKQTRTYNVPISSKLLVETIGMKQISGESNSVPDSDTHPWLDLTLPELLFQYKPEDVFF